MTDPSQYDDENQVSNDDYPGFDEPVSKSELKRQSAQQQRVGEQLVNLSDAHLKTIPLDDELGDAVALARRINRKKDGYRRQLQFIGKLMRSRDLEPIEIALAKLQHQHNEHNALLHKLEKARDAIASQGDDAIEPLLTEFPQLERQQLRHFHRAIVKERSNNKPPKAYRELFQYLKGLIVD
ncbi:ribosome-associated protein [Aestuariibacter sp. GS-14]|uniref:ribosome biogenesis factor YjgA n=1 Tax=Aestuariibacter sp. GS-14 TaxID=2590670 RepID=UPI00112D62E9|nr:ribosome biogenesis factor YjgA [Aestuariibacter sp. GS-14]TPV57326.1 ribosome-associated protein [Aestuariibacter sp. GS-14]